MATSKPPIALKWQSNTLLILATVAIGLFTDLFLYSLIAPQDRVNISEKHQYI